MFRIQICVGNIQKLNSLANLSCKELAEIMTNWHSGCYVGEHFWGLPLVKTHSSIPKDTHKCQAVAPDNTWEILSHPNGGQNHDKLA